MTSTISADTVASAAAAAGVDTQIVRRVIVGLEVDGNVRARIVDALEQLGVNRAQLDRIAKAALPADHAQPLLRVRAHDAAPDALDGTFDNISAEAIESAASDAGVTVRAVRRYLFGIVPPDHERARIDDALVAVGVDPALVDALDDRDRVQVVRAGNGARVSIRDQGVGPRVDGGRLRFEEITGAASTHVAIVPDDVDVGVLVGREALIARISKESRARRPLAAATRPGGTGENRRDRPGQFTTTTRIEP